MYFTRSGWLWIRRWAFIIIITSTE